jgi:uncharacterized C2H2 Zn-finger protein
MHCNFILKNKPTKQCPFCDEACRTDKKLMNHILNAHNSSISKKRKKIESNSEIVRS